MGGYKWRETAVSRGGNEDFMKKFQNIVLATDLDGTFLTKDPEGRRRNLEAIEYFKENGGHFTFATGRAPCNVTGEDYFVTGELLNLPAAVGNGSVLYDFSTERAVWKADTPRALLVELYTEMKGHSPSAVLTPTWEDPLGAPDTWREGDFFKLDIRDEGRSVTSLYEALACRFGDRLVLTKRSEESFDVQAIAYTKAMALEQLRRLYFDHPVTLCVAGDYHNDLEMMGAADLAFCPENAVEEVKTISDAVLCHCDKGLMADIVAAIEKMIDRGELSWP